jgi:hypothetical protein
VSVIVGSVVVDPYTLCRKLVNASGEQWNVGLCGNLRLFACLRARGCRVHNLCLGPSSTLVRDNSSLCFRFRANSAEGEKGRTK